jgi:hypothetical protein
MSATTARAPRSGVAGSDFGTLILDGMAKSPISALRVIPPSLRPTAGTPHSTGFARLELGPFSKPSVVMAFYDFIILARLRFGGASIDEFSRRFKWFVAIGRDPAFSLLSVKLNAKRHQNITRSHGRQPASG